MSDTCYVKNPPLPLSPVHFPEIIVAARSGETWAAEALFIDLQPQGVDVSMVHPGFVATPLTAQNTFHMPALITPAQAAQAILQGWRDGEFNIHFPKRFTLWLHLLRLLPYRWYFAVARRLTA